MMVSVAQIVKKLENLPEEKLAVVLDIEALNQALGPSGALRFLALLYREPADYVEISRRLYEWQTIEEIFDRAKKHWKQ